MKGIVILLAAVMFVVCADQKCTSDKDCPAGTTCRKEICAARPECPMMAPPKPPAGCKVEQYLDEKKCPLAKVVC